MESEVSSRVESDACRTKADTTRLFYRVLIAQIRTPLIIWLSVMLSTDFVITSVCKFPIQPSLTSPRPSSRLRARCADYSIFFFLTLSAVLPPPTNPKLSGEAVSS